jgi:hypothetical protein
VCVGVGGIEVSAGRLGRGRLANWIDGPAGSGPGVFSLSLSLSSAGSSALAEVELGEEDSMAVSVGSAIEGGRVLGDGEDGDVGRERVDRPRGGSRMCSSKSISGAFLSTDVGRGLSMRLPEPDIFALAFFRDEGREEALLDFLEEEALDLDFV